MQRWSDDFKLLARFWPYARPDRNHFFLAIVAIPLASLATLAQPYLLKKGIDDYILVGDRAGLTLIAFLFFGTICLEYLFRAVQMFGLQVVGQRSVGRLRNAIFAHVLRLSQRYLDRNPTGALLTRSTTDVEALSQTLAMGVVSIVGDLVTLVGIVVAMLWLDFRLSLLLLVLVPLLVAIIEFFRRRQKGLFLTIRKSLATLNGYLQEQLSGREVVQLFGHEKESLSTFKSLNHRFFSAYTWANFFDALLYSVMEALSAFTIAVMLWFGAGWHREGYLSLGLLVAFIEYIQKLFIPIKEFSSKFTTMQQATTALERIFDLLETRDVVEEERVVLDERREDPAG
ncbi:MAG: ABC transporter ATP-binding protein, partial [Deltaproteobacteria bacterium]